MSLIVIPLRNNQLLIRDAETGIDAGILTQSGSMLQTVLELRSFGPFREGQRTGAIWQIGMGTLDDWITTSLHTLFGDTDARVQMPSGQTPPLTMYLREFTLGGLG